MTYIDLINTVLRRLREDSIDTASSWSGSLISSNIITDYQIMIGDIVNEAKREVEDAWNWSILRASPTITTIANTQQYNVTGTNERTRILMAQEQTHGTILQEMSDPYLQFMKYPASSVQKTIPHYYSVTGIDPSTNEIVVEFEPVPDAAYNITFRVVNPQNDLSLATDTLRVPHYPVMLGALARAIAERGEDGGQMSDMVSMQYQNALADAIQIDAGRTVGEVDFYAS